MAQVGTLYQSMQVVVMDHKGYPELQSESLHTTLLYGKPAGK